MFKLEMPRDSNQTLKQTQYYSFSKENVENLIMDLESKVEIMTGNRTSPDFQAFFDMFSSAIDTHCKLEKPKTTKRNPVNNPWITDGIIEAISVKDELYDDWIKSKNLKEFSPQGNSKLHLKFKKYRKCLKHIIKRQKNKFLNAKPN